ncbi:hypothetical protein Tco_0234923, partial [Tanacetum coccineum]
ANNSACMSLISRLMSLMTQRVSTIWSLPDAYGQYLEVLLTQPAASESESDVPNAVSE